MRSRDSKQAKRVARQSRVRATVKGTSARPRLCVNKSLTNIYAQLIDDETRTTLVSASTLDKEVTTKASNVEAAKEVGTLIGSSPATIAQYIEVRGVGIVNVVHMFGAGAYRETKKIRLVIELEAWDKNKVYDRLGTGDLTETYFHTNLPKIVIPILPGRNNAVLVEAAAMNSKLKYLGLDGSKELIERIGRITRGEQL